MTCERRMIRDAMRTPENPLVGTPSHKGCNFYHSSCLKKNVNIDLR